MAGGRGEGGDVSVERLGFQESTCLSTQAERLVGKCVREGLTHGSCHFLQNSLLLEAVWRLHVQNIVSLQELLERYTSDYLPLN